MSGGAGTDTIVGSGYLMPEDMYLRKIEQTCMYESPTMVEDFQRSTLKDMRPSKPFFESDQPLGDGTGINPNSQRFLDFRDTGRLSKYEPHLPDGTFLDWQFLEKDPRGTAQGPDMRKHADQQYARAGNINFYPDNDDSIPESGWNPYQAQMQIRNAQTQVKDRLRIFDTAFDNFHNGGIGVRSGVSVIEQYDADQVIKDVAMDRSNRAHKTTSLSNDTSIGWRRTTDHRFKVAKYGKTNKARLMSGDSWYKNRANVHLDHDMLVSWQETNVTKATALLMIDLAKQKRNAHRTGMHTKFAHSEDAQNGRKYKLTPADMAGMAKRETFETRTSDAHTELDGESAPATRVMKHDENNIEKTIINPIVFETMARINQKSRKRDVKDLRDVIQQTAANSNLYMVEKNATQHKGASGNSLLWKSIANFKKGDEKQIFQYKAATRGVDSHNMERLSQDDGFKSNSYITDQRRGNIDNTDIQQVGGTNLDADFAVERVRSKSVGPMGNKYMNKYHERDGTVNDINDRVSR
jgi:hypothetical protein